MLHARETSCVAANAAARVVVGIGQSRGAGSRPSSGRGIGHRGLTPHETVIRRAFAAVETVNLRIADLQKTGGMKEINAEFKEARKSGTAVRYQDFMHAKKMACWKRLRGTNNGSRFNPRRRHQA